jgi:hypothetical protein
MPIAYRVDHDARVVVAVGYGIVTDADVFEYQRTVWSRSDVGGFDELIDMTPVTRIEGSSPERVRELAQVAASMDSPASQSRLAVIASADVAFGLGRMFQTYRQLNEQSTKQVGIFRTTDDALAFLKIDHPVVMPVPA